MKLADFIRKLATVVFVLAFIGAFLLAKEISTTRSLANLFTGRVDEEIDIVTYIGVLIGSWISSGVTCALLYSVGEVLEYLYSINMKMSTINEKSVSQEKRSGKTDKPIFSDHSSKPDKDSWRCENCEKYNLNYVGTCGCGTSKN